MSGRPTDQRTNQPTDKYPGDGVGGGNAEVMMDTKGSENKYIDNFGYKCSEERFVVDVGLDG